MVVGIAHTLERGRLYTRDELRKCLHIESAPFEQLLDSLLDSHRLRVRAVVEGEAAGFDASGRPLASVRCVCDERTTRFEVA